MSIFSEFKTFIARGNVIDLAVGIVIGAAFTGIVSSLVADIVMPIVGVLTSGVDFSDKFVAINGESYANLKAAKDAGAPVVTYGVFINSLINFLIVSFVIFLIVKQVNKLKKDPPPAATPEDILLLREIRDSLKK